MAPVKTASLVASMASDAAQLSVKALRDAVLGNHLLEPVSRCRMVYNSWTSNLHGPKGEAAMPSYRYRCVRCDETFERVESITEHGTDKPRCPKCGGEEVVQVPAPFVAVTTKKS